MQVYAVLYSRDGSFLIAHKPHKGYFFSTRGGCIVKDGQLLNGHDKYALPGGKLNPGETIVAGAAREFGEETKLQVAQHNAQKFQRNDTFGAGYFEVAPADLQHFNQLINLRHLPAARHAAEAVASGKISSYQEIFRSYPEAPADNELDFVETWNVLDPYWWKTIQSWQQDKDLSWYYEILLHLRTQILGQLSQDGPAAGSVTSPAAF